VIPNFGELGELLKNAGKFKELMEKATEALGRIEVEGSAAGGAVTARANGRLEILSVRIDPKLIQDNDREMLEDLVTAAVNHALARAREEATRSVQGAANPLGFAGDLSRLFRPGG
jgi:DNA-binding YbaB/EbfC family protein